jgi:hypothetical protein
MALLRHSYEGFYAPVFPVLINAIRKTLAPWPFDLADHDSALARLIAPRRRALWLGARFGPGLAAAAGLLNAANASLTLEFGALTSRPLVLFETNAFLVACGAWIAGTAWALPLAIVLGVLVLYTHKLSVQLLWFLVPFLALAAGDARWHGRQAAKLLDYNPFILFAPAAAWAQLGPDARFACAWVAGTCLWGCATYFLCPLRCLGEGNKYFKYAFLPSLCAAAALWVEAPGPMALAAGVLAASWTGWSYWQTARRMRGTLAATGRLSPALATLLGRIGAIAGARLLCLPVHLCDRVAITRAVRCSGERMVLASPWPSRSSRCCASRSNISSPPMR